MKFGSLTVEKERKIAFWKPQFDHVRSAKSLLPTYMETTSLACQGFLSSRAFQANEEQTDLEIYGPQGIKSFVLTSLRVSGSRLPYRIHFHEFDQDSLGKILETDKFTVYAEKLDHTIFCVGYRVIQKDLEGTLDAEKLKAAGVPFGPLLEKLKRSGRCFGRRY